MADIAKDIDDQQEESTSEAQGPADILTWSLHGQKTDRNGSVMRCAASVLRTSWMTKTSTS